MDEDRKVQLPWLSEVHDLVQQALVKQTDDIGNCRPSLEAEQAELSVKTRGWSESLAKVGLPAPVRKALEDEFAEALIRIQEIDSILQGLDSRGAVAEESVQMDEVVSRLDRLGEVLGKSSTTLGNLELSLHIDKISCYPDGHVTLRTCKLGSFPGALDLLLDEMLSKPELTKAESTANGKPAKRSRRRRRLRVDTGEGRAAELLAAADMAADPDRFADLPDEFFWNDEFQIPARSPSWVADNCEAVFNRRQKDRLSYDQLADEFDVSSRTIGNAIQHYLDAHPGAKDEVRLPRGGKRPKKFDLSTIGPECRELWEGGQTKDELAKKVGCSVPTIDKALAYAYEQEGLNMPTRDEVRRENVATARYLLDDGADLEEIAERLKISDVTARAYLRESFKAEGKTMPDLRRSDRPA